MVPVRQFIAALILISTAICSGHAWALPEDFLLNIPQVKGPEAGSLTGSLARYNPSATDMARGVMRLPLPIEFDESRGPLLVQLAPSYSIENGLTEWGMGWANNLAIKRFRKQGDLDFKTDNFVSPWGELQRGTDGFWYPKGLKSLVRVQILEHQAKAWTPDGLLMEFAYLVPGREEGSVYAYQLTKVSNPQGQLTLLAWSNDLSSPVLEEVRYGGYSAGSLPYSIKISYENRPESKRFVSFRSGRPAAISKRVALVQFFDLTMSLIKARWSYTFSHSEASYTPAFYLETLQRSFASGAMDPAINFRHEHFEEIVKTSKFEQSKALDSILQKDGGVGLLSNQKVSIYDHDLDGRIDIEIGPKNKLYLQTDQGFVESAVYQQDEIPHPCLPAPKDTNRGRQIARLAGPFSEPRVILNTAGSSGETNITVCSLTGDVIYTQIFRRIFTPDRLTAFGDINNDGKPDYVRAGESTLSLLENTSDSNSISFRASGDFPFNARNNLPSQLSIVDLNGDGISDILSMDSSAVRVFFGKGNMRFTDPVIMGFTNSFGRPFVMSGATPSFADINSDGMTDLILSKGAQAVMLVNLGQGFQVINLPFTLGTANEGDALVGNINGSGDLMVFRVVGSNRVFTLQLSTPGTHLLREVDDGKGNVLKIQYGYGAASVGQVKMRKKISGIETATTGKSSRSISFSYEAPQLDSAIPSLLGYGIVEESNKQTRTRVLFDNPEAQPGLVRSTVIQDVSEGTDGHKVHSETDYSIFEFAGLSGFRQKESRRFKTIKGLKTRIHRTTQSWDDQGCLDHSISFIGGDSLRSDYEYFRASGLSQHATCLVSRLSLQGRHEIDRLDFSETWLKNYNEFGQLTHLIQEAYGKQRVLQQIEYDSLKRISQIKALNSTTHDYNYEQDSQLLAEHRTNVGVKETVGSRIPTGQIQTLEINRGDTNNLRTTYNYDGWERLIHQWNNVDGNPNGTPIEKVDYAFATRNSLGKLTIERALSPDSIFKIERYLTSDGDLLTEATNWGGMRILSPSVQSNSAIGRSMTAAAQSFAISQFDPGRQWESLFTGNRILGEYQYDGFGEMKWSTVAHNIARWERHDIAHDSEYGLLRVSDTQNGKFTANQIRDENDRIISKIDESNAKWTFTYDSLNRLREVVMPSGEKQTADYNSWGELEHISRDNIGSVMYEYDDRGLKRKAVFKDILNQIDRVISMEYDAWGRIVMQRMDSSRKRQEISYYYDGNTGTPEIYPNELGNLTAIKGDDFLYQYRHDPKGRIVEEKHLVFSAKTSAKIVNGYYPDNRIKTVARSYKIDNVTKNFVWDYQLDQDGFLKTVLINGAHVAELKRDKLARISSALLNNNQAHVDFNYNVFTQAIDGYTLTQGTKSQSYSIWKDDRGNFEKEEWTFANSTERRSYDYDSRSFLEAATPSNGATESFYYNQDALLDSISNPGFSKADMDTFGRMRSLNGWEAIYGPNGQIASAMRSTDSIEFSYDHRDHLIARRKNGKTTQVWLGGALVRGADVIEPLKIDGINIAILLNGQLHPMLSDVRGTVLTVDDFISNSDPYGASGLHSPWSDLMDFAGMPYDSDMKMVRMGVRFYSPELKQFISYDPLFFENIDNCLESPVECNLYSYARNNPLRFVDPSGEITVDISLRSFAPFTEFGFGFHGDNRGFSTSDHVSSRIATSFTYDTSSQKISNLRSFSSPTIHNWTGLEGREIPKAAASFQNGIVKASHEGGNPVTPKLFTPKIDVTSRYSISEGHDFISVRTKMSGDAFPNAETYIGDKAGNRVMLHTFETTGGRNLGPMTLLWGDQQRSMGQSDVKIYHNQAGHFTGFEGHGRSQYVK